MVLVGDGYKDVRSKSFVDDSKPPSNFWLAAMPFIFILILLMATAAATTRC
jgi:hypothetical protein